MIGCSMVCYICKNQKELTLKNATNPEQGLRMSMVLKRKIMSKMMTTYFPSILLMLITFATILFKPMYFEASLSVNFTTMLVMTTIFISKMEGLPPTSGCLVRWLDIHTCPRLYACRQLFSSYNKAYLFSALRLSSALTIFK